MVSPGFELVLVGRLALAVFLAPVIGVERELRQEHAGLRTHALVGLDAALFVEVSAYGLARCWKRAGLSSTPHGSLPRCGLG